MAYSIVNHYYICTPGSISNLFSLPREDPKYPGPGDYNLAASEKFSTEWNKAPVWTMAHNETMLDVHRRNFNKQPGPGKMLLWYRCIDNACNQCVNHENFNR